LVAYLRADHMKAVHRRLCRQLAMLACIWSVVALTTSALTTGPTLVGFAMIGGVACWAVFREWGADIRISALIGDSLHDHRESSSLR
jgi:hypothetical protein